MHVTTRTIRPLGAIGVEILDVDLFDPHDVHQRTLIVEAFNKHAVLLFRDQSLCPHNLISLTRLFGQVRPHPLQSHRGPSSYPELSIVEHGPGLRTRRNDIWHSDASFAKYPPTATVLHAIEVPQALGDTMICNMVRAYQQLSHGLKAALAGLFCLHNAAAENEQVRRQQQLEKTISGPEAVAHPLVLTHQPSAQESLYINPHYVTHIDGFTLAESRPLLNCLYRNALRPENIYRHRWRTGDVLIWDNTRTMHYAIRDYDGDTVRVMHRTSASSSPG